MKSFLSKFIDRNRNYFLLIIFLLISLSILPLNNHPQVSKIKSYAFGAFAVFTSAVNFLINIVSSDDELEKQKLLNAELMLENSRLKSLGLENNQLRKMLSLKDTSNYPLITASVISKIVDNIHGNMIINIGADNNITAGMPVINERGLLGVISDVSRNFSVVRTLFNANFKIAVMDQRSGIEGILGWNGSNLVISNIAVTEDIKIGDKIITSDFSTLVPPAIPVGVVISKRASYSGLLNDIIVEPFVDFGISRKVFVMSIVTDDEIIALRKKIERGKNDQ